MGRRWLALCALVVGAFALSSAARAAEDVPTLEKQLADQLATLSTSDCNLACRALASIRRAADRICALEPGPRCDAARAKAAEAARRVEAACPECARVDVPLSDGVEMEQAPPSRSTVVAAQAEPRGGCRSCMTAPTRNPSDFAWLALVGWTALFVRRRPKKDRR